MRFKLGYDPRRGRKPKKISYETIRAMWAVKSQDPNYTKCALARELELSIRTVRSVLNGTVKVSPSKPKPPTTTNPNRPPSKPKGGFMGGFF